MGTVEEGKQVVMKRKPCGSWKDFYDGDYKHRHLCGRLGNHEGDHECWSCRTTWPQRKEKRNG